MTSITKENLIKINEVTWEIPKSFRSDMRVAARIYASKEMLDDMFEDKTLTQLVNLTTLPGVQKYALVMPDGHEGYGSPIGGVVATAAFREGIISPGICGYDINCGVRLLLSEFSFKDIEQHLDKLADNLYKEVPSGVGQGGRLKLNGRELDLVLKSGARRMVEMGYGEKEDLGKLESGGILEGAEPSKVSERAKARGRDQLGTMGAGNHFVEVGKVEKILDREWAEKFGLFEDQVTVLIHTGSRGLGHQIATDYIRLMMAVMATYGISLPDRELAAAPFSSREGQDYFSAMQAGANFAWANRQLITWEVRESWKRAGLTGELKILYDVAHNIAKVETYDNEELVVHRKGATRAFPGEPVLIPGSMGTASYVLVGLEGSMRNTFGTSCHGAGREMSRTEARRRVQGKPLKEKLEQEGVRVRAGSWSGLAEEAPEAYKNVDEVVEVVEKAGIAKRVARLKPIAVVKG